MLPQCRVQMKRDEVPIPAADNCIGGKATQDYTIYIISVLCNSTAAARNSRCQRLNYIYACIQYHPRCDNPDCLRSKSHTLQYESSRKETNHTGLIVVGILLLATSPSTSTAGDVTASPDMNLMRCSACSPSPS